MANLRMHKVEQNGIEKDDSEIPEEDTETEGLGELRCISIVLAFFFLFSFSCSEAYTVA